MIAPGFVNALDVDDDDDDDDDDGNNGEKGGLFVAASSPVRSLWSVASSERSASVLAGREKASAAWTLSFSTCTWGTASSHTVCQIFN